MRGAPLRRKATNRAVSGAIATNVDIVVMVNKDAMLTGRPLESGSNSDANRIAQALALYGLEKGSGVTEKIGDKIGVDDISVGSDWETDDAALMLGERDWALSLCNRLLAEAPESANGHYQRACANAGLGFREAALADLHRAVELSDAMRQPAWSEVEFEGLRDMPEFAEILGPRSEGDSTRPAE